jgi:hypothetical protein
MEKIMQIPIVIETGDALKIKADVLVLKYAQDLFGVDYQATNKLAKFHNKLFDLLPPKGDFLQVQTFGSFGVNEVLYVGVVYLYEFRYQNIREFSRKALEYLAENSPDIRHVCFTLHGAGYGLDEMEAFEAEIAGFVDALSEHNFPKKLEKITIVEWRKDRAQRLRNYLSTLLPDGIVKINKKGTLRNMANSASNRLREVGYASESKPFVFVAMPFKKDMYDAFHYGIRGAINKAGYLCERVDEAYFTGDIMEQVKRRIREAAFVVADLTSANPNVYLEIGYAWGIGQKTVLLIQDPEELKFDVQGQRCLVYDGIKELEELLQEELNNMS